MKKVFALLLTLTLAMSLLAGCGGQSSGGDSTPAEGDAPAGTQLSGSVSLNGSTSMEKVVGALNEQFMADNSGVSLQRQRRHRPQFPRPKGRGDRRRPDGHHRGPGRHRCHRQSR